MFVWGQGRVNHHMYTMHCPVVYCEGDGLIFRPGKNMQHMPATPAGTEGAICPGSIKLGGRNSSWQH